MNPDTTSVTMLPALWVGAVAVFAVIIVQNIIYLRAAKAAAVGIGMPESEFKAAYRAGGSTAVGPSLAVALVALALLPIFGTPSTMTRIGLIGSAAYELIAANSAVSTMDAELGGEGFTPEVFITMLLALSIGGCGWMVATLIFTPIMKRGSRRLATAGSGTTPATSKVSRWAIVPTAALFGVFLTMGLDQVAGSFGGAAVFGISAAVMLLLVFISQHFNVRWLKNWGLGISMLVALALGYLAL